jgi:predicted nucleic acid-binding protein
LSRFIDTNVIVAAAVAQDPGEHRRAVAALEAIYSGRTKHVVTEPVLTEVSALLLSRRVGRLTREEIAAYLLSFIGQPNVELQGKDLWRRTLQLTVSHNIDLPDAHMAALMEQDRGGQVVSFDRDFDRIPGVQRIEP